MKRLLLLLIFVPALLQPVSALEIQPPTVPESALEYFPQETHTFTEDLYYIIRTALSDLTPNFRDACSTCLSMIAVTLLISLTECISDRAVVIGEFVGAVSIGSLLLKPVNTLIRLGTQTVIEISEYSKLLLPVMCTALAAEGGVTASGGLYIGTAFLNSTISSLISSLLVPVLYVYLCICVANSAIGLKTLSGIKDFLKWAISWVLKILLYVFTGYMSITGVVSGATDASTLKAAKLTISGSIPVVGTILSDASEAVIISVGTLKSAAGIYGILAIIAIWIGPFLRIGIQYLMLKLTATVCSVISSNRITNLLNDFSCGMGIVLAMTGTVCLLQLISIVCFMKGIR